MPKGFVFKLQPVLDQRLREEKRHQRLVAEIERRRLEIEERIRACQRGIAAAKEDLRDRLGAGRSGQGVALLDVRMQASASLHLVGLAQQAVFELAGVHKHVDAARLELLKAATARKAVELLKTRRLEQWKRDLARREAAEADELNVMRHARKEDAA